MRWLQDLIAQDPKPGDSVSAWLNPSLASRLERAGVPTLIALVERINGLGARWWVQVPGVGELKAVRIQDWLRANEAVLGMRVGAHVAQPRRQVGPMDLAGVVPAATAIRPYEKLLLPAELDGSAGRFRGPPDNACSGQPMTTRRSASGLPSKGAANRGRELTSTQRSYRR